MIKLKKSRREYTLTPCVQGPEKEYLGKLQYELKYDFNTQVFIFWKL